MTAQDQRSSRRVPVALRIRLRYDKVEQFISKFAVNISHGGMFLASRNPKPVGTRLHFEMRLADDTPVINGVGEVRWVRPYDRAKPTEPHGMGIEFTELSKRSRELIDRMLEHRRSLSEADSGGSAGPVAALDPSPAQSAKSPKRKKRATSSRKPESQVSEAAEQAIEQARDLQRPASIDSALARARALAGGLIGGDLDAELDAILQAQAVPREITVEAASRELAERLGGQAVETKPHPTGPAAAAAAEAAPAEKAQAEAVPAEKAEADAAEKAQAEADAAEKAQAEADAAEKAQAEADAAEKAQGQAARPALPGVEPVEDEGASASEPREPVTQLSDPVERGIEESAPAVPIEIDDVVSVLDAESGDEIEIDFEDLLDDDDDDAPTSVG